MHAEARAVAASPPLPRSRRCRQSRRLPKQVPEAHAHTCRLHNASCADSMAEAGARLRRRPEAAEPAPPDREDDGEDERRALPAAVLLPPAGAAHLPGRPSDSFYSRLNRARAAAGGAGEPARSHRADRPSGMGRARCVPGARPPASPHAGLAARRDALQALGCLPHGAGPPAIAAACALSPTTRPSRSCSWPSWSAAPTAPPPPPPPGCYCALAGGTLAWQVARPRRWVQRLVLLRARHAGWRPQPCLPRAQRQCLQGLGAAPPRPAARPAALRAGGSFRSPCCAC